MRAKENPVEFYRVFLWGGFWRFVGVVQVPMHWIWVLEFRVQEENTPIARFSRKKKTRPGGAGFFFCAGEGTALGGQVLGVVHVPIAEI